MSVCALSGEVHVNDGPLIVQSDKTLLLEVDHPKSDDCRHAIRLLLSWSGLPSTSTPTE